MVKFGNILKNKRNIGLYIVPVLLWMGIIFYMSHQVAEVSSDMSGSLTLLLMRAVIPNFETFSYELQMGYVGNLEHMIRKCAHMGEYAILGMLMLRAMYACGNQFVASYVGEKKSVCNIWCADTKMKKYWLLSWILGTLYAVTDEVHQLFISGRSGQISDVMIDSTGVIIGIFIYHYMKVMIEKYKRMNAK